MTKMQAVVSSASMMLVNLSLRRSRRLLASSQAFACSTTQLNENGVGRPVPIAWKGEREPVNVLVYGAREAGGTVSWSYSDTDGTCEPPDSWFDLPPVPEQGLPAWPQPPQQPQPVLKASD